MQSDTILYAEDDDNYATLLQATFRQGKFNHRLHVVKDGSEAIAYLKGEGIYSDRSQFPLPCVLLADLKMPRINGLELLSWVRQQSAFPHLPVVILTCTDEYRDIKKAYTAGANSFLVKPPHVEDLKALIKMLDGFWVQFNRTESADPRRPLSAMEPGNVIAMNQEPQDDMGTDRRSA